MQLPFFSRNMKPFTVRKMYKILSVDVSQTKTYNPVDVMQLSNSKFFTFWWEVIGVVR